MSPGQSTTVTAQFAGATRIFRLGHAELFELETGAPWHPAAGNRHLNGLAARAENPTRARGPIQQLFARLRGDAWTISDIAEPIRLGLIGGGTVRAEADALIGQHVFSGPLLETRQIATSILAAALVGNPEPETT